MTGSSQLGQKVVGGRLGGDANYRAVRREYCVDITVTAGVALRSAVLFFVTRYSVRVCAT